MEQHAPLRIAVQPDERIHDRISPRPPMTELLNRVPHDWLTAFEDLEKWDIAVEGACGPKIRRCTYRPLFHDTHIEFTWSSMTDGKITLVPPKPLPLPERWDTVTLWIGGVPDDYQGPKMDCTFRLPDLGLAWIGSSHQIFT